MSLAAFRKRVQLSLTELFQFRTLEMLRA